MQTSSENDRLNRTIKAVLKVAYAFALPADDMQISTVAEILLSKFKAEDIERASDNMVFDEDLAERIRYTRGITVVDFSRFISKLEPEGSSRFAYIKKLFWRHANPSITNEELVRTINSYLRVGGFEETTAHEVNEIMR